MLYFFFFHIPQLGSIYLSCLKASEKNFEEMTWSDSHNSKSDKYYE